MNAFNEKKNVYYYLIFVSAFLIKINLKSVLLIIIRSNFHPFD